MGFTLIFEKSGEQKCENWSEIEFTSFGENAITSIFAKGWDSLRFSKKMVKKTSKIGQKMNSVSYLDQNVFIFHLLNISNLTGSTIKTRMAISQKEVIRK